MDFPCEKTITQYGVKVGSGWLFRAGKDLYADSHQFVAFPSEKSARRCIRLTGRGELIKQTRIVRFEKA